jgi:hypothetical protein
MCKSTVDTSTINCQRDKGETQVDSLVMPVFGATVTVRSTLHRRYRSEIRNDRYGGTYRAELKVWEEKATEPRQGLLIGYRNLSNGTREYDSECGYLYIPKEYFRAAVVVFSERENPVYVPISGLA